MLVLAVFVTGHMTGSGGEGEWVLCQQAKHSGIIELCRLGLKQNLFHM